MNEKEQQLDRNNEKVSHEIETDDQKIADDDSGEPKILYNKITNSKTFKGEIGKYSSVKDEKGEESRL